MIGVGAHRGEGRALEAAKKAIKSPLLEDVSIEGAKGLLINITAGSNLTLFEANEAASVIQEVAGEEANIIFGTVIDESLVDEIQLTVIATGFYLNQGRFEPAAEETAGVRRLSARTREKARAAEARAPIAVGALEERSAVGAGDETVISAPLRDDLDYPAILRKKLA